MELTDINLTIELGSNRIPFLCFSRRMHEYDRKNKSQRSYANSHDVSVNFHPAAVSGSPHTEVSWGTTRSLDVHVLLSNTRAV